MRNFLIPLKLFIKYKYLFLQIFYTRFHCMYNNLDSSSSVGINSKERSCIYYYSRTLGGFGNSAMETFDQRIDSNPSGNSLKHRQIDSWKHLLAAEPAVRQFIEISLRWPNHTQSQYI